MSRPDPSSALGERSIRSATTLSRDGSTSAEEPEGRGASPAADARSPVDVVWPAVSLDGPRWDEPWPSRGGGQEQTGRAPHPPGTEVAPAAWRRSALAPAGTPDDLAATRSAVGAGWPVVIPTASSSGHRPSAARPTAPGRHSEEAPSGVAPDGASSRACGERASTAGPVGVSRSASRGSDRTRRRRRFGSAGPARAMRDSSVSSLKTSSSANRPSTFSPAGSTSPESMVSASASNSSRVRTSV